MCMNGAILNSKNVLPVSQTTPELLQFFGASVNSVDSLILTRAEASSVLRYGKYKIKMKQ
jgi:hypothetical protein